MVLQCNSASLFLPCDYRWFVITLATWLWRATLHVHFREQRQLSTWIYHCIDEEQPMLSSTSVIIRLRHGQRFFKLNCGATRWSEKYRGCLGFGLGLRLETITSPFSTYISPLNSSWSHNRLAVLEGLTDWGGVSQVNKIGWWEEKGFSIDQISECKLDLYATKRNVWSTTCTNFPASYLHRFET